MLGKGNCMLSAEILEQVKYLTLCLNVFKVFLYLNHEDLMTLLTVCKFWAAVAERPQLWTEFRQVVKKIYINHILLAQAGGWQA